MKPQPALLRNNFPLSVPVSTCTVLKFLTISNALVGLRGMYAWRAKPLPEPVGMIPIAVFVLSNPPAHSFTVPSPPAAMTASRFLSTASLLHCSASPRLVVKRMSHVNSFLGNSLSMSCGKWLADQIPEPGLMMKSS